MRLPPSTASRRKLFEAWDSSDRYVVYSNPNGIKELELLDYGENDPSEASENKDGGSFFEVMESLITKCNAITTDMETVLTELDSAFEPFHHSKSN